MKRSLPLLLMLCATFLVAPFSMPSTANAQARQDCWNTPLDANGDGQNDPPQKCTEQGYFCEIPADPPPGRLPGVGKCRCAFGDIEAPIPGGPSGDVCLWVARNNSSPLLTYARFFAQALIALTVAAGIVMVVIGGYVYMTAGGSAERIGRAKSIVGMAILGIALALTGFIILNTISPQFAADVEEPILTAPSPAP